MDRAPVRLDDGRRLSPAEVEAVLARAIELHLRSSPERRGDLLSEAELLRIGEELGVPAHHVRQALVEVDGGLAPEEGRLARHLGPGRAGASRIVERRADDVRRELERYLLETECMVVERRFAGRTVYAAGSGVLASATRATRRLAGRHPLIGAERLEVAVQELGAASCCVAVALDLRRKRRDVAVTGVIGGGIGATAGVAAGVVLAPPAVLAAAPLAAAAYLGSRAAYRSTLAENAARLESLLDRVEHRDLGRGPALRALLGL